MIKRVALCAVAAFVVASPASAQAKRAANTIVYDLTVTAEGKPYTGTMTLAVAGGKVTGDMHITVPTEITGKVAGTAKAGQLNLDFPYRMVERGCEGQIAFPITLPAKKSAAPITSTATIAACGEPQNKITGAVELKPQTAKKTK
jgi:hypothetical protein